MTEMTGKQAILIEAPVEQVYAYIADFPKHCEWNDGLVHMKRITNGPIAVGSQFHTEEKIPDDIPAVMKMMMPMMNVMMGIKDYTEAEITAMEPNRSLAWSAGLPMRSGYMLRSTWELVLEPQGNRTLLTQSFRFMPQNMMTRMMSNDAQALKIAQGVERNLAALKQIVEA